MVLCMVILVWIKSIQFKHIEYAHTSLGVKSTESNYTYQIKINKKFYAKTFYSKKTFYKHVGLQLSKHNFGWLQIMWDYN